MRAGRKRREKKVSSNTEISKKFEKRGLLEKEERKKLKDVG